MPSSWFATVPAKSDRTRITLNFGLSRAERQFHELVVPQLGRIWFVRQLSWPVAALSLAEQLRENRNAKPTAISHALEALGCKLEWWNDRDSDRVLGKRAFARDHDESVYDFARLRSRQHYVQNTYRQAATRPLRVDVGFGLVTGGRFNSFALTDIGKELANAFLDQVAGGKNGRVRQKLLDWIARDELHGTPALSKALMPSTPSEAERAILYRRVFGVAGEACRRRCDASKCLGTGVNLRDTNEVAARLRDAGRTAHADDLVAARSFGAMLDRARNLAALITDRVGNARLPWPLVEAASDREIKTTVGLLKQAGHDFLRDADTARFTESRSRAFAHALQSDLAFVVQHVARATKDVLLVADQGVMRGPLFRVIETTEELRQVLDSDEESDALEPDSTGRTFRLANLHSLARDLGGKS